MRKNHLRSTYGVGRLKCIEQIFPSPPKMSRSCLDVGCSAGPFNNAIRHLARKNGYAYVGIDLQKESLLKAKKRKKREDEDFVVADGSFLPFVEAFKLVIALEVIEHLEKPENLIYEIARVLQTDGQLLISTPNKFSMEGIIGIFLGLRTGRKWTAWDDSHRHIFSSMEFLVLIQKNFVVEKIGGYHFLPSVLAKKWYWIAWLNSFTRTFQYPTNRLCFNSVVRSKKKTHSPIRN